MSGPRRAPAAENTQQGIRRRNLSLVLHTVADHGPLSRAAVAGRIGLTRAAVSSLVDELIRTGLLTDLGLEQSGTVGRPGSALSLGDRFVLQPDLATWGYQPPTGGTAVSDGFHYASDTNDQWYSIEEIRKILESDV